MNLRETLAQRVREIDNPFKGRDDIVFTCALEAAAKLITESPELEWADTLATLREALSLPDASAGGILRKVGALSERVAIAEAELRKANATLVPQLVAALKAARDAATNSLLTVPASYSPLPPSWQTNNRFTLEEFMTDIHAAAELAKSIVEYWENHGRFRQTSGDENFGEPSDVRIGRTLLAILQDPTQLLKPPVWEEGTLYRTWESVVDCYAVWEHDGVWWWQSDGREPVKVPSIEAAQAACEADYRERMRGAFING